MLWAASSSSSGSVGSVRISRCISRLPGGHPKLFLYVSAFALLPVRLIPLIVAPVVIFMNTKAAETHEQPLCYIPDQVNTPAWMHSSRAEKPLRDITACFGSVRWTEIFSPRLLNLLILSLKNKSGAELFLVFFSESCCLLEAESRLRLERKQIFSLWISFRQQCSSLLWLTCRNHLLWRCRCGFGMKGHRVCRSTTKVARSNWGT